METNETENYLKKFPQIINKYIPSKVFKILNNSGVPQDYFF